MDDRFLNRNQAIADLQLTPQEQFLYQHHLSNLYGGGSLIRPNGDVSTVYQATVGVGGKQYNLPTIWQGQELPIEAAIQRAQQVGLDKYPSYATPQEAEARYQAMHPYMERDLQQIQGADAKQAIANLLLQRQYAGKP